METSWRRICGRAIVAGELVLARDAEDRRPGSV